jgi:tetrahydromethanopterin S-methyltransferase subunit B
MSNAQPIPNTLGKLRRRLRSIATRVRMLMVLRALCFTVSLLGLSVVVIAGADYLLRLPSDVRLVVLVGLGVLLVYMLWTRVRPAWRARLQETETALIIEQHNPAMRGLLASAIDLSKQERDSEDTVAEDLRDAAIRTAARRLDHSAMPPILRFGVLARSGSALVVTAGVFVAIALLNQALFSAGIQRILTPWSDARWPVRYAIWDVTPLEARAVDVPIPLRALVGNEESELENPARALVNWRILDGNGDAIGDWSRTLLMPQRRRDNDRGIPVYEQLIDPRERVSRRPSDQRFTLEYRINTRDDRTQTRRIALVRPPRLASTDIEIQLPDYAAVIAGTGTVESGTFAPKSTEARIAPVLAGSRVRIRWTFSKPIADDPAPPAWIERVLAGAQVDSYTRPDDRSLELLFNAQAPILIEPVIADLTGVPVREPISVALDVIEDLSPSVRLLEPPRDENLTPSANIIVAAEISDDLGLTRAGLWAQRFTPPEGSSGAPPEPSGDPIEVLSVGLSMSARATPSHGLDLAPLGLLPGDELHIWADTYDLRAETDRPSLGYARSGVRVIGVVTQEQLIEQVRSSLDPLRNNLRSLDERQGEVQQLLRDASPRAADEQRTLTERLRANQSALQQLNQTVQRNAIDDETLRQTIEDAASVIEEAARQSERADDQIRRGEDESAAGSQRQVRNRLGELLSMLDQGQDAWLALRDVQQLRAELESIQEQTQELAQRTAGQSLEEMSPEDRSTLEQILERQTENAEDARDAINQLDQRAQELEESDPTQADALRRAAEQARAAQIEQQLREAGAQIEQNQTSSATQTQEEVLEELEELLEELENTIQNRDNALRRQLASIMESLGQLIDAQEREIARLDVMILDERFEGMDQRLIALVRNTLSVRDEALGAFPETRSIADHITRAANAQSGAINALRAEPVAPDEAQAGQRAALGHLRNALEEAQRLDEEAAQRQTERAREELRKQYGSILDTQTRIHDETVALGEENLSRRLRSQARSLGSEQLTLAEELAAMLEDHEGLSDAPIFTLAHQQLDRLMSSSAEGLSARSIDERTRSSQRRAMSVLASLIDVLQEDQQQQEDFEDGQTQGQGSGGQQGGAEQALIPPVAQLKLLRSMQQLVMDQTRALSETESPDTEEVYFVGELQRQLYEQGTSLIDSMNPSPESPETPVPDGESGNSEPIEPVETDSP